MKRVISVLVIVLITHTLALENVYASYITCDSGNYSINNSGIDMGDDEILDGEIAKVFLEAEYNDSQNRLKIKMKITEESRLGAGDFVISWKSECIKYVSFQKKTQPTFFNVNDKMAQDGVVKLSIISLADIIDAREIIVLTFDVIKPHDDVNIVFDISGSGLADSLTKPIQLEFENYVQKIPGECNYGAWFVVEKPTCVECGIEKHVCSVCNKEETRDINPTGHIWEDFWTIDESATKEKTGVKSHHCSNCDARIDETVIRILTEKGDFDDDNEITVADALAALRIAAKLVAEDDTSIEIGDVDGDSHVTVADALAILRVAAKIVGEL